MVRDTAIATRNNTIERHLGCTLINKASVVAANTKGSHRTSSPPAASPSDAEMASLLQHMLDKYVALLETSDHGGWTLDEDTTVRTVYLVLSRLSQNGPGGEIEDSRKDKRLR